MKKVTVAILAIAITVTGAILAFGQTGGQDGPGKRGFGRHGKMGKKGNMMRVLRHVDLTDDQKAQIKAIHQSTRETVKPIRQQMRENRKQLAELSETGTFDAAAVEALAGQQAQLTKQLIIEKEKAKSQVFSVLTDEQKGKLAEIKAKMKERRQLRMERMKERFGAKKADQ